MGFNHPSLAFLQRKNVIYYAGLDQMAVPSWQEARSSPPCVREDLARVNALLMVSDHVVIPPTFHIERIPSDPKQAAAYVRGLLPFYESGAITSAVYSSMASCADFLQFKRHHGSPSERARLECPPQELFTLFDNMPLVQRDVTTQSRGFRDRVLRRAERVRSAPFEDIRARVSEAETRREIALSRHTFLPILDDLHHRHKISRRVYRSLFFGMNAAYYGQGAETYEASISCTGAESLFSLGKQMYVGEKAAILVAYDPDLILSILEAHGVDRVTVSAMSSQDLHWLRNTQVHRGFVRRYGEFARSLQSCLEGVGRCSKSRLAALKGEILTSFGHEYSRGLELQKRLMRRLGFGGTVGSTVALGAAGFFLLPLYGALLAAVPLALQVLGITRRVSDWIAHRIARGDTIFADYIELLKRLEHRVLDETL